MEKVRIYSISDVYECDRCNQYYCEDCNSRVEVDFDIEDASESHPNQKQNWKGLEVCPFCYNQLIDLKREK